MAAQRTWIAVRASGTAREVISANGRNDGSHANVLRQHPSQKKISHFFAKPLHIPTSSRYNHAPKQDVNDIAENTLQI
jgi:hypothetical protein